jgi:hypothetical protein
MNSIQFGTKMQDAMQDTRQSAVPMSFIDKARRFDFWEYFAGG